MNRRSLMRDTALLALTVALTTPRSVWARTVNRAYPPAANGIAYEVQKTGAEWRAILTPTEFAVLREEKTERQFSSPLNDEKREGIYHCAGCDLPVYPSRTKFDSGTGWPSFFDSLTDAVRTKEDNSFFATRTEVHCRRCGGHFGHIFEDGPEPTGLRHCLNGAALRFRPKV